MLINIISTAPAKCDGLTATCTAQASNVLELDSKGADLLKSNPECFVGTLVMTNQSCRSILDCQLDNKGKDICSLREVKKEDVKVTITK